jgi:hypothetical protein
MDFELPLLLVVVAAAVVEAALVSGPKRARAWRQAAERAGLTSLKVSRSFGLVSGLSGRAGPLEVRLKEHHAEERLRTRVTLSGLAHGRGELVFGEVKFGAGREKQVVPREAMELGDPLFDARVRLRGSPELACAIFGAENRRLVLQLVQGRLEGPVAPMVELEGTAWLANGTLEVGLSERADLPTRACLFEALPRLIAIARGLVRPPDLVDRLAHNLRHDPLPAVRQTNLAVLVERHRDHPRAQEALLDALGDRSEEIRLRAALAVGERGHPTLFDIASSDQSDDQRAGRAITALGEHLSGEQAEAILVQALRTRRLATAQACIEDLGRRGGTGAVDLLSRVLAVEKWALAAAAARALGATGQAAAETPLIEALAGGSPDVLLAVAEALARVGTAAAVMPLRAASDRLGEIAFRRAARQAIAAIQSRVEGASPGQLSLDRSETGQVSLVDEVRGRVSPPEA